MYSTAGRGGAGAPGPGRMGGRYMKGRLPPGVAFREYPGRSGTPLPTAESKGTERMNQLKIWNEAAGAKKGSGGLGGGEGSEGSEGRRLGRAAGGSGGSGGGRRTDSFKEAQERQSASFQVERREEEERRTGHGDRFADRSDSESGGEIENGEVREVGRKAEEEMGHTMSGGQNAAEAGVRARGDKGRGGPAHGRVEKMGTQIHQVDTVVSTAAPPPKERPRENPIQDGRPQPSVPEKKEQLPEKEKRRCCIVQ